METKWLSVKLDSKILEKLKLNSKTCKQCVVPCFHPKCKKV